MTPYSESSPDELPPLAVAVRIAYFAMGYVLGVVSLAVLTLFLSDPAPQRTYVPLIVPAEIGPCRPHAVTVDPQEHVGEAMISCPGGSITTHAEGGLVVNICECPAR